MSPEVTDIYRGFLDECAAMMEEAETDEERQAISSVIATCQLRLAGVK